MIDPGNYQLVGRNGYGEITVMMPRGRMTREQALTHAAWLVEVAGGGDEFPAYLAAIRGT